MKPLSDAQKRLLATASAECEKHRSQVESYLAARGITNPAFVERHRLGFVPSPAPQGLDAYRGRLAIPYIGPRGNVYNMRFRCIQEHDCREVGCPKYLSMDGLPGRLYNVRALTTETDKIVITEGEIDALSVEYAGLPAVGVPGVESWQPHHRRLFDGFAVVYVVGDNDKAGSGFRRKVLNDVRQAEGVTLDLAYKDLNEMLVNEGPDALRGLFEER